MQLIGQLQVGKSDERKGSNGHHVQETDGDVAIHDDETRSTKSPHEIVWRLEFHDIPDAGKQSTSTRLMFRAPVQGSDITAFMSNLGFESVLASSRDGPQC